MPDFDQAAYAIKNFGENMKLREIGKINIDAFEVSRYFSALLKRQHNMSSWTARERKSIEEQIGKVNRFYQGSRCVEFYANWMNYMYFLVVSRKGRVLKDFYKKVQKAISKIDGRFLKQDIFNRRAILASKTKRLLLRHFDICLASALSVDLPEIKKDFPDNMILAERLYQANMFEHSLVSLPLANYLEYNSEVSYSRLNMDKYGEIKKGFSESFKVYGHQGSYNMKNYY